MRTLAVVLMLAALTGCVSGYHKFYRPTQGLDPARVAAHRVSPPPAIPLVERRAPTAEPAQMLDSYAKRGYVMIGSSSFNSGRAESEQGAVKQGEAVGADLVVILNPRYTGSVTSSVPITTPTTTTSYVSGPYGGGMVTTYGSSTTYIPTTVHRSNYAALYLVKQRFGLGVFMRELNDSERQQLQTNKGVAVRLVVDESPAYDADILPGDIITAADGVAVANPRALNQILSERAGQKVSFSIVRQGKTLEKPVTLGQ